MIAWWWLLVALTWQQGDTLYVVSPDRIDTAWISYDSSYTVPIGDYQIVQWNDIKTKRQVHWIIPALIGFVVGGVLVLIVLGVCRVSGDCARCEECKYRDYYYFRETTKDN